MTDLPRIGLALGGGGARGFAHIAVLEAFDELGLAPCAIAGTSIGAIVGAAYCAGMSGADIRAHVLETFRHRGEVLSRLWRARSSAQASGIFAPTLANPAQLNADRLLAAFLPEAVPQDFSHLKTSFTAVAADFYGWKAVGLSRGNLRRAVAASMAIPMMFRPVLIDGRVMVDGGVVDPLPFDFLEGRCDMVVAVDVINGPRGEPGRLPSPYESVLGSMQLLMQAVVAEKIAQRPPDILVQPDISIFRVMDFLKARAILRACEPAKLELKKKLEVHLRGKAPPPL